MRTLTIAALTVGIGLSGPGSLGAQVPFGESLTTAGIYRASAMVDSVFIDRSLPESTVGGGDFGSYLMARLGIIPIPPDLGFRVAVDSSRILLNGRVRDLPAQARQELGTLLSMLPPETPVVAQVELFSAGPRAVRFRLSGVTLGGISVPEPMLQSVMSHVGERYPALTKSGRDLFVEIPPSARVALVFGGVRLVGPDERTATNQ